MTTTQTTAEALEEYMGEISPRDRGYRLRADIANTRSSAGSEARWWDNRTMGIRVVVTDEDGIEIHAFEGADGARGLHLWTASFTSSTPLETILATLESIPGSTRRQPRMTMRAR